MFGGMSSWSYREARVTVVIFELGAKVFYLKLATDLSVRRSERSRELLRGHEKEGALINRSGLEQLSTEPLWRMRSSRGGSVR